MFEITPVLSSISCHFDLQALLYIAGKFDKSHATTKIYSSRQMTGAFFIGFATCLHNFR